MKPFLHRVTRRRFLRRRIGPRRNFAVVGNAGPRRLAVIGPAESFGEMAVIDAAARPGCARGPEPHRPAGRTYDQPAERADRLHPAQRSAPAAPAREIFPPRPPPAEEIRREIAERRVQVERAGLPPEADVRLPPPHRSRLFDHRLTNAVDGRSNDGNFFAFCRRRPAYKSLGYLMRPWARKAPGALLALRHPPQDPRHRSGSRAGPTPRRGPRWENLRPPCARPRRDLRLHPAAGAGVRPAQRAAAGSFQCSLSRRTVLNSSVARATSAGFFAATSVRSAMSWVRSKS